MRFLFDRAGFPLIRVPGAKFDLHVLPVCKVQFEGFLAELNEFGDAWYEQILGLNERVSYRRVTRENREQLFITGILPAEVVAFAKWLGPDFDVLTVQEWRFSYTWLRQEPGPTRDELQEWPAGPSRVILERLVAERKCGSLLSLSLMSNGVAEWVREGQGWSGLGSSLKFNRPRNPLEAEIRPMDLRQRLNCFGCRLARRWEPASR